MRLQRVLISSRVAFSIIFITYLSACSTDYMASVLINTVLSVNKHEIMIMRILYFHLLININVFHREQLYLTTNGEMRTMSNWHSELLKQFASLKAKVADYL